MMDERVEGREEGDADPASHGVCPSSGDASLLHSLSKRVLLGTQAAAEVADLATLFLTSSRLHPS